MATGVNDPPFGREMIPLSAYPTNLHAHGISNELIVHGKTAAARINKLTRGISSDIDGAVKEKCSWSITHHDS